VLNLKGKAEHTEFLLELVHAFFDSRYSHSVTEYIFTEHLLCPSPLLDFDNTTLSKIHKAPVLLELTL
jgi:hypothetical protein